MRSRRTRSRARRDAVTLATAPEPNSTRAFAISRWGESTATPLARPSVGSAAPAGRAGRERRQPVARDVARLAEIRPGRAHGAVDPLDVPHLQRHAPAS